MLRALLSGGESRGEEDLRRAGLGLRGKAFVAGRRRHARHVYPTRREAEVAGFAGVALYRRGPASRSGCTGRVVPVYISRTATASCGGTSRTSRSSVGAVSS